MSEGLTRCTKFETFTNMININLESNTSSQEQHSIVGRIQELSIIIEDLNLLCNELDPYHPLTQEMGKRLATYGVFESDDPFLITNKLVLILENSVEELISLGGTP